MLTRLGGRGRRGSERGEGERGPGMAGAPDFRRISVVGRARTPAAEQGRRRISVLAYRGRGAEVGDGAAPAARGGGDDGGGWSVVVHDPARAGKGEGWERAGPGLTGLEPPVCSPNSGVEAAFEYQSAQWGAKAAPTEQTASCP